MSDSDARRPLRLHATSELVDAPPRPAAPVPPQSADRFRRTLLGTPRRGAGETARGPGRTTSGPAAPASSGATRNGSAAAATADPDELDTPDAIDAPITAVAAAGPADGDDAWPQPQPLSSETALPGPAALPSSDGWPEQMAQQLLHLCRRADPAFVTWTVTVPMDPQVLPDTELRLHLSQHWLSLRFATQSPRSTALISRHRPRLLYLLERMPNFPHGIDIEVT